MHGAAEEKFLTVEIWFMSIFVEKFSLHVFFSTKNTTKKIYATFEFIVSWGLKKSREVKTVCITFPNQFTSSFIKMLTVAFIHFTILKKFTFSALVFRKNDTIFKESFKLILIKTKYMESTLSLWSGWVTFASVDVVIDYHHPLCSSNHPPNQLR